MSEVTKKELSAHRFQMAEEKLASAQFLLNGGFY